MVAKNTLLLAPPYQVEHVIKQLGANLKTARLRRRLTIEQVAQKIGSGVRAVSEAEKGKPSTSIAVYMALLWTFDLLNETKMLADPNLDKEGQALALSRQGIRARSAQGLDNDF